MWSRVENEIIQFVCRCDPRDSKDGGWSGRGSLSPICVPIILFSLISFFGFTLFLRAAYVQPCLLSRLIGCHSIITYVQIHINVGDGDINGNIKAPRIRVTNELDHHLKSKIQSRGQCKWYHAPIMEVQMHAA